MRQQIKNLITYYILPTTIYHPPTTIYQPPSHQPNNKMSMIKGTIWNIATLVIGLKLALSAYGIEIIKGLDTRLAGGILVAVSLWFLFSRIILGPTG